MIWIFWADEEMQVDEAAFGRRYGQTQLESGKDESDGRQSGGVSVPKYLLIGFRHIVVGDCNRFDHW